MSARAYKEILNRAQQELSSDEQLSLSNALHKLAGSNGRRHSITELEGLGKHIWEGINPDQYVRKERDSWGG